MTAAMAAIAAPADRPEGEAGLVMIRTLFPNVVMALLACTLIGATAAQASSSKEFGIPGPSLGSKKLVFGRLIYDDGACRRLPRSECVYERDGYRYLYNDGILESKKIEFPNKTQKAGPFGLNQNSKVSDVKRVMEKFGASVPNCGKIEHLTICYIFMSDGRADFYFNEAGKLKSIEISIGEGI